MEEQAVRSPDKIGQGSRSPHVRRSLLLALAGAAVVFGCLLYENWFLVGQPHFARLESWLADRAREFAAALARDPAPGAALPDVLDGYPWIGSSSPHAPRRLVVFGGPLTSCCSDKPISVLRVLAAAAQQAGGHPVEMALVLRAPVPEAIRFAAERRLDFPVVADEGGELENRYNAFWTPRAYALVNGRLAWMQKRRNSDSGGVDTQGLLEAVSERPPTARTSRTTPAMALEGQPLRWALKGGK